MGLDMYLYICKNTYKSDFDKDINIYPDELKELAEGIAKRNFLSRSIEEYYQVGYWRKANAIHRFFVEHCADGVDDCRRIYVSVEKLTDLLDRCKKIFADSEKAKDLLPTQEGFFFGGVEYDDWYFENISYTIDLIERIIDFVNKNSSMDYAIYYKASW